MRYESTVILLVILGSILVVPVHASGVTMTIRNGTIASEMALSFHQNMTQFPSQITRLDGATDSSLMDSFAKALKNADPNATLSQLNVTISSSSNWMNVTASMGVSGVSAQSGDITNTTTTWRSFYVAADLRAGNLSFNTVGSRYLRPVYDYYVNATRYIGKPNATISGITFLSNDTSIGGDQAANQAGNLTLLDFKPLNTSLNQWDYRYNLENDTTTWRYSPAPIVTSSIKVTKGLNSTSTLIADYGYSAEIVVTGLARSQGDGVVVDVGSGIKELIMAGAVIFAIVGAIWIQFLYRARRKRAILGRR